MMPNINRLTGRFFTVLISLTLAFCLPRAAFAGGSTKSPAPTLCQISDTVYRADGSPAQGTVLVSWQGFTTSAGQAVTPGSLLVTLDSSGGFNANLAPNTGASPAGSYYRAIFKLDDGTTETEIWVVPNTQTTTIGAIRSKLVPAQQAAQFLTRDFADSNYVSLASTQTITGVKTFGTSPAVPTPQNPTDAANKAYVNNNSGGTQLLGQANTWGGKQTFNVSPAVPTPQGSTDAANKAYVDANSGSGNLASPPPIGNTTPNTGGFTVLTAQDSQAKNFPEFNLRSAGVIGDGQYIGNCSIASGQTALICTGASFAGADVGKGAFLANAGNAAGNIYLNTTIATYVSQTQVTLAAPAQAAVNNGMFYYGTDITTAWCNAVNCNSAIVPNKVTSPQPGRILRLPHGTYFTTGTLYTRNGDVLVGDGGTATEIYQFDSTGTKDLLQVGSNATGGGTLDSGGLLNVVKGILFAQPENTTSSCINAMNGSGVDIIDNWFFCNIGIMGQGNELRLLRNTCDLNTGQCMIVKGNGAQTNNPTHSVLIEGTDCYANRYSCFQVDGATDVLINHNFINFAKQFGIYLASPTNQTSYRVVVTDNSFITSTDPGYYYSTQDHIYMATPCVDCSISHGNKFALSRQFDIDLESAGISGLKIMGNQFYAGQGTSLNVGQAGQGLTVQSNNFDSPGNYAADFSTPGVISGNYCHNPFAVAGLPANDYDKACFRFANSNAAGSKASDNVTDSSSAAAVGFRAGAFPAYSSGNRSGWPTADVYVYTGAGAAIASANERAYNGTGVNSVFTTMSDPSTGNASFAGSGSFGGNLTVGGDLSARDIPGVEYHVSKYAGIQAAINAAYNNGAVLGTVVDDRVAPYSGPGFILYDSVTLKLAATTYTITSTVTYNNGNNNVTAGIIAIPGGRLIGAGTSTNHGTIITAGNGLNADLIATSSVGTGTGGNVQWWHWGEIGNMRIIGNGANQTAGDCLKVENMGETARVHDIEFSACYANNMEFIGYSATQSAVTNITSNLSTGGSGVAFTNLAGVGVLDGISGDCNHTALINANFGASGTVDIHGLKAEAESSICPSQVQDPAILSTTTAGTVAASINLSGGYAFGTTQQNFLKSTGPGSIQFTLANFYLTGYTNILNDAVRGQVIANSSTTTKQPVAYLSNGVIYGNQAFTFQPNTFMQGNPNGTPTEIFGQTSSGGALLAAPGNGDNSSPATGGIQIAGFNRTIFGQTPESMARAGYRFLGPGLGYDTTRFDIVPVWNAGDSSDRYLGSPLTVCLSGSNTVSCRWPHIFGIDVNGSVFTAGTYTIATLPAGYGAGAFAWAGDSADGSCTSGHGGGSTVVLCRNSGSAWVAYGGASSGGAVSSVFGRTSAVTAQSGDYTAAQVTGAVANTTTVNGHPLSSNVTVSASDITSGTLPHAQLPALVSGDIPNNAANTSGTAGGLSGAPALPNGTTVTTQAYEDSSTKPASTAYVQANTVHTVAGTMQGQTSAITGTGAMATLYSATIPAGTAAVGTGFKCRAYFRHSTGGATVTMQWKLGSTSQAYATTFTGGNSGAVADIEIFTPSSTNAEIVNIPYTYFGGTLNGPATGLAWSENLTTASTIYLQFNVASTDKLTGDTFYCQTIQ